MRAAPVSGQSNVQTRGGEEYKWRVAKGTTIQGLANVPIMRAKSGMRVIWRERILNDEEKGSM